MAPLAVAQSVLEQYEQALDEVGKVAGLASRPSISDAKKALRSLGYPVLASRLGRLSKKRNGVAHPDPGLLSAISAVRGGGEVAAKNAVQLLDDAGEAPVSEPAGEPPVPLGGGLAHEGGHDQPPFPAAEQDVVEVSGDGEADGPSVGGAAQVEVVLEALATAQRGASLPHLAPCSHCERFDHLLRNGGEFLCPTCYGLAYVGAASGWAQTSWSSASWCSGNGGAQAWAHPKRHGGGHRRWHG